MHNSPSAEQFEAHGCSVTLRRLEGPKALELFLSCQPPADVMDAGEQAEAIYHAIDTVLQEEGGSSASVVSEMVFLRDPGSNVALVREARDRVLASTTAASGAALIEIEQPPLNEHNCLEVSVQAVLPIESMQRQPIEVEPTCSCAECLSAHGLRIQLGEEARFYASGLCGAGDNAYEQTTNMFTLAEELLQKAGMEFSDVVRAWIHLGEMERDYPELNKSRREFFKARGIDPVPASTGIGGNPISGSHNLCLGVYAVKAGEPPVRTVMTSPTLNEAGEYGADFVRGMKMAESNKIALHVSGTASIDEEGRTAHVGDFEAQVDRMLVNVSALLERQGASIGDIVSAITYLKHPSDADRFREKLHEAGFGGFPNVMVVAEVCRPELLCETEVLAVLPVTS
ncbi:MAG: RidA family protein [Halioglobus sp.]